MCVCIDFITDKCVFSHLNILLSSLEMIEKRTTPMHLSSVTALEQQLDKWKSNALIEAFDSISNESQKSSLMIEFLEKNESHLLEEIDRVAGIYGKLEEQQSKKVFDLAQKRDQALKLQAEVKEKLQLMISIIYAVSFRYFRNLNMHKHLHR